MRWTRFELRQCAAVAAVAVVLSLLPYAASAAEHRFSALLDTDNSPATGCTVTTASGPVHGVERVATTVVNTSTLNATVARLEMQACGGGVLGAPSVYDAGGWNVGLGNGTGGMAVIETSVPLGSLPPGGTLKAVIASSNSTSGQDATAPFSITIANAPATPVQPIPLSPWLALPLGLMIFGAAAWWNRRHPGQPGLAVIVLLVVGSGMVWAATVIRDGNVGDWGGIPPAVTDTAGDAPVDADIVAVFYQQDGSSLYLRIDADVRKDAAGNAAPVVNAGANQSITLPAAANLAGTATDDGLPNPPGALTTTWSVVSGPAGVVFGNANALATTATFSVSGTYVLRLTAFDGALSANSTLQISANDAGNVGPQIAPIADRVIEFGTRFQQLVQATSPDINEILTYALPTAPLGAGLQPAPLIDWMPTLPQLGTQNFTARVTDSHGRTASTSFRVTVVQTNHPPHLAPQADASVKIGATFARTLTGTDPDAGDTLIFALVAGPAGMVLTGANLSWPTSGNAVGDYGVTVNVTDAGGLSDTRSFTIKLTPLVRPVAKGDGYEVRLGQTLAVNATLGVLVNDLSPEGTPLTASKLTNPDKGTLNAFNADGSFNFTAPPTFPGPVFTPVVKYSLSAFPYGWAHQPTVIDVDNDGVPEIIANSLLPGGNGLAAYHVKNGALELMWDMPDVSSLPQTADCTTYYAGGEPMRLAAGDIDDSGQISIVIPVACKRDIPTVPSWTAARYVAVNARDGTFKWLSPSLGGTRPEPVWGGTSEDSIAYGTVPAIARMRVGESPSIVFANEYANDAWGTENRCERIKPGFVGAYCRAAFVLNGADGTVRQKMAALASDSISAPTQGTNSTKPAVIVADLDGTGNMNVIFGATVWNADGSIRWNITDSPATDPNSHIFTFWNGLGNFDDTPDIEIVRLDRKASDAGGGPARLSVFKSDGRMLWSTLLSGDPWNGIPTIADVDGSGHPSAVVMDRQRVCAIDYRGMYKWCHDGGTSALADTPNLRVATRAAIYDLDGDGIPEVIVPIYGERLRFLDGATGKVKYEFDMAAGRPPLETGPDYRDPAISGSPIVADFENSGHASILTVWSPDPRMDIVASQNNDWRPARKIFNQTSYHVGNVNDNGSIPAAFFNNFANPATNVFGTQAQVLAPVDPRVRSQTSWSYAASASGVASDPATVKIEILPANRPPAFTSTPPRTYVPFAYTSGSPFVYQAHAVDPDAGDTLTYSIQVSSGPDVSTCTIGAITGKLQCTTINGGSGNVALAVPESFLIAATDSFGESAYQTFTIYPSSGPATVPNVVGQSKATADATLTAAGFVVGTVNAIFSAAPLDQVLSQYPPGGASVLKGEAIALQISKGLAPQVMPNLVGMQLTQARALLVSLGLSDNVSAVSSATAPANEVVAQSPAFGATIQPPATVALDVSLGPPLVGTVTQIIVEPSPSSLRVVGETLAYRATAVFTDGTSTDVTIRSLWSSSAPAVASIDSLGGAKALSSGATTINATAGGKTGQATLNVVSRTPGDNLTPVALITAPADDGTVSGPVTVIGTATDANFLRYELAYALAGDTTWTVFGEGTAAVTAGTLGTFDPTTLLNDLYTLRLTVFDRNGNQTVAASTVQVTGGLKVGLFTLGFRDLNVELAGVPITVTRTYDSRDKAKGDFGIGWRLGLQTLRLRTNRVPGTGWIRSVSGALVSLTPTSPHKVSITLPDGRVEEFDLVVSPTSNLGSLDATTAVGYSARFGTQGKLEVLGNTNLLIVNGGTEDELVDDLTLDTYNPTLYRYTTLDGTKIELHRTEGVRKITDSNGNAITIGPNGIVHSGGQSIAFLRDAQGRITSVTDLLGNAQTYVYDANGDLAAHTDPAGGVSRFAYDRHHGLIDIRNALGTQVVRNEFDTSGMLIAMTDADGKQITFSHNLAANEEIITDRLGRPTRVVYDLRGNVVQQEQAVTINGTLASVAITNTYDAQNNLVARVDADGMKTASTFSGVLPLTRTLDPTGLNLQTAFAYNARNDVTSATDPGGRAFGFSYDVNGNLVGYVTPLAGAGTSNSNTQGLSVLNRDAMGNTTAMTRDAAGRVTREDFLDAGSVLLRRVDTSFDANGNKIGVTLFRTINGTSTALTTRYAYDAANRLVSVTDALGAVSRTDYDANGRITVLTDPLGRRTSYAYDALGRVIRTTFADGSFESALYDAEGNVVTTTDRAGRMTTHIYDELKRQVKSILPDGSSMETVYSAGGRVSATIDALGNRTEYAYDSAGRRISTTFPAVVNGVGGPFARPQVAATLNALGASASTTDPNGHLTSYIYDGNGRLIQTIFPGGTSVRQTFDALGRRTSITNEDGQTTTFGYDGLGRLISVSGLAGDATYTYDEAGNLLTQSDALGRITRLQYDAANRLIQRQYPSGTTEQFAYDAAGNLIARTDGSGRVTAFTYDAMNRVTGKTLPGGATVAYSYKPDGQRASVTDFRGVTSYGYDALGRLAVVAHPTGETLNYARDANGNLKTLASPTANVDYSYDALNRLVQVNAPEGASQAFYDLAGNRLRQTVANGIVIDASFDMRNRPTSLIHKSGATPLQSYANIYSPAGRRTQITELDGSVESFSYDAKGRLAAESRTGSNPHNITHSYDAVGNRLQTVRGGTPTTFNYDNDDHLVSDNKATYTWDANGNLVGKTQGGVVTQYGYDAEDRLISITGGGLTNQFQYDADGNRVQTTDATGVTRFLVDTANNTGVSQVIEERNGAGSLQARYTYGNELIAMDHSGTRRFNLRDSFGSSRALADTSANLTDRYQYDAFGNSTSTSGTSINPYRYRGQRLDTDTDLYQLRARYYPPAQARFTTRDPLPGRRELPVSNHRYIYANDDPVNTFDPTGRESLPELSFAQGLNSWIDVSGLATDLGAKCSIANSADQVNTAIAMTQLYINFIGAGAVLANALNAGFGKDGGRYAATSDVGYDSGELADNGTNSLKKLSFTLKGSGGQFGLNGALELWRSPGFEGQVLMLPPPVKVQGLFKISGEKEIMNFKACHLLSLGKVVIKGEAGAGLAFDDKGAFGAGALTTSIEASLFRGALKYGWPLIEIKQEGLSTTGTLLGSIPLFAFRPF